MSVLRIVLIAVVLPAAVFACDDGQPRWYPLKGVKSGEILLNCELPAPGAGKAYNESKSDGPILHVDLIKAKNLIKADMIGKSDPYAVLKYANQKDKTNVAKNTQNPEWNHSSDFDLNPGDDTPLIIEVFDSDKLGKDKSLGSVEVNPRD